MARLKQWALDNSSPIFWLGGMAGTGKSTVAYTLCQHLRKEGRLGASFFCSRNDEKARSRASIIPTIVRQLLYVKRPFTHFLRDVHLDDVIPASGRHVDELLVQPWLRAMASQLEEQPPLVVVIDALDEIEGNDQGPHLIKQLIQAVSASETRLRGLKFLVTSRPHRGIMKECSSIERKAVYRMEEIVLEEAIEDVRRFVNAELDDLPRERRETIVTNSAGLFIYAATIARYVCPPNQILNLPQFSKQSASISWRKPASARWHQTARQSQSSSSPHSTKPSLPMCSAMLGRRWRRRSVCYTQLSLLVGLSQSWTLLLSSSMLVTRWMK